MLLVVSSKKLDLQPSPTMKVTNHGKTKCSNISQEQEKKKSVAAETMQKLFVLPQAICTASVRFFDG